MTGVLKAKVDGVWTPVTSDTSGGGVDEVSVGSATPGDTVELWYDTNAPAAPFGLVANPDNALGIVAMGSLINSQLTGATAVPAQPTVTSISQPLTMTFQVGRRYRIVAVIRAVAPQAGVGNLRTNLFMDGVDAYPTFGDRYAIISGSFDSYDAEFLFNGDGLQHTLVLQATPSIAVNIYTNLGAFYVEDVGPVGSPALPIPATPPAWELLAYANGWSSYSGTYPALAIQRVGDRRYLRGLILHANPTNFIFTVLPVSDRPARTEMFNSLVYNAGVDKGGRFDIRSNGEIAFVGLAGAVAYGSVQCTYSVAP